VLSAITMHQCLGAQEGAEQLRSSYGLALGSPFIDIDIVDFAFKVPPRAFSNGRRYKALLRNVAYDHLDASIKQWPNPPPEFDLSHAEIRSLERILPPDKWTLVELDIVDPAWLQTFFSSAPEDAVNSEYIVDLVITEMVVRNIC
jgi:hypothetical protein